MFGMYKRLRNEFTGVMTGKGLTWGGSVIRPEATGYGAVYFAAEMLKTRKEELKGKTCLVSGSGNVAQYTVEKLISLGAKPVTLSDSAGYIFDEEGIDREKLAFVMDLKNVRRGRISEYADKFKGAVYTPLDPKLRSQPTLESQGAVRIPERDPERNQRQGRGESFEERRLRRFGRREHADHDRWDESVPRGGILFGPGKAANAGGVATSGLEMAQNSMRISWTREEVDNRLYQYHEDDPRSLSPHGREDTARRGIT